MTTESLLLALNIALGLVVLVVLLLRRPPAPDLSSLAARADVERVERSAREGTSEVRDAMTKALEAFGERVEKLSDRNELRLNAIRDTMDGRLRALQEDNAQKLEQMRVTVDEKLQSTLDQRLTESFKLVSDRLEQVHQGLGAMQALAEGVGDLKKVLTNVKTRGTWGEFQLGALLEQVLTPDQYAANVSTTGNGREMVEFAVKFPGDGGDEDYVWLPIDSKFPMEDYMLLMDAYDRGDGAAAERAGAALEARVRSCARDIREKYVAPPRTTDFGVLFLPTEGLYAEVLRRPGLTERLQMEYRITVTGPTTLAALLNSLRMGFRTLAIQKQSSEVWKVLGGVKAEFTKFGGVMDKVQKKLQEATNAVESVSTRARVMQRKLNKVEAVQEVGQLPADADAAAAALGPGDREGTLPDDAFADEA